MLNFEDLQYFETDALAQIEVEILLFFSLKNKRLQRKAGNSS